MDNNSEEKEDTFNYNYTIQTTQNSEEYSSGNILLDIEGELDTVEEEGKTIMCPYKCIQCKADKYCLKCAPHFDIDGEDHTKCVELVPNCEIFKEVTTNICRGCKEGFFLVKENNGDFTCEEESDDNKEKYFYVETQEETEDEEGLTYYKRCDSEVPFCKACSSKTKCTECISNDYTLIDNGEICGILSTKKYYEVSEGNYISCSKNPSNQFCEKCELVDGNYVCLECKEGYAFFFDGTGENVCESKEGRADFNNYYSTDNQNYYPCNNRQYNDIDNCIKCSNKETCNECNSGYTLVNGNQLCLLNTDISNKKYYQDSEKNDYYFPCSESLEHCDICEDKSTCTTCETDYIIEEASNHCISKTLYDEKKYYKNVATGKYVSCSNISGCEKCISATKCILCSSNLNISGCEKCISATKCILCSSNLFLVKEDENIDSLTCKDINENQYYQVTEDDITFYKKCTMSHCEECTALDHCTKCEDNYVIIEDDDHTVCEDLSTQKYYYDTQTTKYKLCSTYSNTFMILKQLNINYVPLIQIHAKNVKWMMIIILYA